MLKYSIALLFAAQVSTAFAVQVDTKTPAADLPFPSVMECLSQPVYRYRPDGKAGREIAVKFKGAKLFAPAELTVECDGRTETVAVPASTGGTVAMTVLLPEGAGVAKECQARLTLRSAGHEISCSITVPMKRQWTVFLYPHSHVDIGYTQSQEIVEKITVRNLKIGMQVAKDSSGHPDGARYVWNPEAVWASENFLNQATPEEKAEYVAAAKAGQIGIDASYAHLNTSVCSDEELLRYFQGGLRLGKLTGAPITSMVQMDVPGAAWGLPLAAAQCGIRGLIDFPNGFDRIGDIHCHYERPFYWVAPDGKSRILYIQGPRYDLGWGWKGSKLRPEPYPHYENPAAWVQDYPPVMDRIRTANPSANFMPLDFITAETTAIEREGLPYDYFTMTWSMSDNSIIDADLPDAVKAWNETYAYPKLVIASAHTIIEAYEKKFGGVIPEKRGDLTEYWTDGLGTDALRVGYNRLAKERLTQTEILWSMLNRNHTGSTPVNAIYDAWRWVTLGSEHTWGYHNPAKPIAKKIEAVKASYFENAKTASEKLLNETLNPVAVADSATVAVFNALSWPRTGLVTLPKGVSSLKDAVTQKLSTGETVFIAKDIPALGSKLFTATASTGSAQSNFTVSPTSLENELVEVTLNPQTGDIASLVDKRTGHDFVDAKSPYALNSYRYLRGADSASKATGPTEVKISIKENGPVVASLIVESKAEGCTKLSREIRLLAGQPQVEFINTVDKIATRQKEGVHFGFAFNVPDGIMRMDIPWGVMIPPKDQLPGSNKNWLAFQRWMDVANAEHGVTWTAIEAPLVEIGDITANLLGGVHDLRQWRKTIPHSQTIFSWALNNHWHTNFPLEQGGIIPFHYAVLPHGAYDPVTVNRFGLEQNRPLIAVRTKQKLAEVPPVAIDNPRIFLSTLKPAEDGNGFILRLRSLSDQPETVKLTWPAGAPQSVRICPLEENPGAPAGKQIEMLPYGSVTVKMEFN